MAKKTVEIILTNSSEDASQTFLLVTECKCRNQKFQIKISETKILICYKPYKTVSLIDVFHKPAINQLIKKLFIAYILLLRKDFITENNVSKVIYDEEEITNIEPIFPVYSMFNNCNNLPNLNLTNKSIIEIINTNDFANDKRICAITNYLLSFTKTYEVERFLYLWMSLNSIYSYKYCKENGKSGTDNDKIRFFAKSIGFEGETFSTDERNDFFPWIKDFLYVNIERLNNKDDELTQIYNTISDYVYMKCGKRENGYCLVLLQFCYSFRCFFFHGNQSAPSHCTKDDKDWKLIQFLNDMLKEFLKKQIENLYIEN